MAQPLPIQAPPSAPRPASPLRSVPAELAPAAPAVRACTCGHSKVAHQHYRAGSNCALCGCGRFHRPLLSRLRLLS